MYTERLNLHKQIAESQKILREKFKKFKKGEYDIEDGITKTFKPIIQPLNELVENSNSTNKNPMIRHSTPEYDNYSEIDYDNDDIKSKNQPNKTFNVSENPEFSVNHLFETNEGSNILDSKNPEITEDLSNHEQVENNTALPKLDTQKLVNRYLKFVKRNDNSKIDQVLGVRKLVKGPRIGDSSFTYDKKSFKIRGNAYKITPGLTELIFNKNPNEYLITKEDQNNYKNIIHSMNSNKKRYKPDNSIRKNIGDKYMKYISEIVKGHGIQDS